VTNVAVLWVVAGIVAVLIGLAVYDAQVKLEAWDYERHRED